MSFLSEYRIEPATYLRQARASARKHGYTEPIEFATDGKHKLQITLEPSGRTKTIKFGLVGYKDFLIYSALERRGEIPRGTAAQKRENYHKRQKRGEKYSAASLSRNIQW